MCRTASTGSQICLAANSVQLDAQINMSLISIYCLGCRQACPRATFHFILKVKATNEDSRMALILSNFVIVLDKNELNFENYISSESRGERREKICSTRLEKEQ